MPTSTDLSPPVATSATLHKLGILAQAAPGVSYNLAVLATSTPNLGTDTTQGAPGGCPDGSCIPSRKSVPVRGPILRQETDFTCGPSSARNIVLWLTGTNVPEATLKTEMKTTDSTYWVELRRELNERQNHTDYIGSNPYDGDLPIQSPGDLMQRASASVHYDGVPVILNVAMEGLEYYNGHVGKHFNMSYGYDHAGGGYIKIADEWDPTYVGYSLSRYGNENPYGYHAERLATAYTAVKGNKSLIIW